MYRVPIHNNPLAYVASHQYVPLINSVCFNSKKTNLFLSGRCRNKTSSFQFGKNRFFFFLFNVLLKKVDVIWLGFRRENKNESYRNIARKKDGISILFLDILFLDSLDCSRTRLVWSSICNKKKIWDKWYFVGLIFLFHLCSN